jgi:hypothetical protein
MAARSSALTGNGRTSIAPLNALVWFKGFLKSQSNFNRGVQPIKAEHVAEMEKLVAEQAKDQG